jgi:polyisoprenoid-binding protein YceI
LTVPADALDLADQVKPGDRAEIMERMRRDVLETSAFPEITFRSTDASSRTISPGRSRVRIAGQLALHGIARPHTIDAELQILDDSLRLLGTCPLRLSDYRISPVSALGGTIRLKDELTLRFDLIGLRGGS